MVYELTNCNNIRDDVLSLQLESPPVFSYSSETNLDLIRYKHPTSLTDMPVKTCIKVIKVYLTVVIYRINLKRHPQKSKDCQHTNTIIWWASNIFLRRDNINIFLCICDRHKNQTLGPILTEFYTQVFWFIILDKFIIGKNHLINRFKMADILNTKTMIFLKKHFVSQPSEGP